MRCRRFLKDFSLFFHLEVSSSPSIYVIVSRAANNARSRHRCARDISPPSLPFPCPPAANMQDEEKYPVEPKVAASPSGSGDDGEELPVPATGVLAKLRGWEAALDRKIGVENHGIERRRPEDRDPSYASWSNQAVMFLMWMSATTNLSCFSTGFLGWELGLDLSRTIVIVIFSTLIGSAVTVSFDAPSVGTDKLSLAGPRVPRS